ncbi:MAG TPA: hypothetical protein VFH48_16380 [Chloroflexota bacterium]|nr:hypothetical protein [Chloroflexota bacterium]
MATCWECEATTSQAIVVTIELPSGHGPRVQLCPSCYQMHYLPLIAESAADGVREAPAESTRRSPGTGGDRR